MDADAADVRRNFFDHPLYRMGHLHGTRWVTFAPDEQHNPSDDDLSGEWSGGVVLRCAECDERVVVVPA